MASQVLKLRRARSDVLPPELFAEPAWDLLLELFVADSEGLRLTGNDVARRADIQPSVMSRWLKHLSKIGLIIGDGSGELGDTLTLSGKALGDIERLMTNAYEDKAASAER